MTLPATCAEALSGHLAAGDETSAAPHLDGSARAARHGDDPGYWEDVSPTAGRLAELPDMADAGRLEALRGVKIL